MERTTLARPALASVALPASRGTSRTQLSVVVPFYNPGLALRRTVRALTECLRQAGVAFEIIAVSDGSTDGSEDSLAGIGFEVKVLRQERNQGKGAALRRGFAHAAGEFVGFVDADGDIDPQHVLRYYRIAAAGGYDAVYADKRHPGSANESTAVRRLISRTFSTVVGSLFRIGVRDTQTGCKVFARDAVSQVLPTLRERRFALDIELFVALRATGRTNLVAVPVRIETRLAGSTVSAKSIVRTLGDTLRIFGRRLRGHYATVVPAPRVATRSVPATAA